MSFDLSDEKLNLVRARQRVHKPGYKFSVEKRIECVTKYLALGNMRLVSELTGVSYDLLRRWKGTDWWGDLELEIKASRNIQTTNKLSKIVDKALDTIADRLDNGDVVFNQKTGTVVRKEVSLKDANKVATDLLTRQAVIEKQNTDENTTKNTLSIQEQLKQLATEFARFNGRNTGPVQDAVIIGETSAVHDEWGPLEPETGEFGENEDFSETA